VELDSEEARRARVRDCGVRGAGHLRECDEVFEAGQVLVCLRGDNGKAYFAGGFKKMSSIGKSFQKLCRPMKPIVTGPN